MGLSFLFGQSFAAIETRSEPNLVEVYGTVADLTGECPSLSFTVGGQRVVTYPRTEFEGMSCSLMRNGRQAQVGGVMRKEGVLVAREVDVK